jgi:hypothetical protein
MVRREPRHRTRTVNVRTETASVAVARNAVTEDLVTLTACANTQRSTYRSMACSGIWNTGGRASDGAQSRGRCKALSPLLANVRLDEVEKPATIRGLRPPEKKVSTQSLTRTIWNDVPRKGTQQG